MKQQIFASYVPSSYPIKMEVSHLSYRSAQSGPTTPDSQQHAFDEALLFNTAPQEHFNVPISRETEGPLGTWLMDVPASASPRSSRMSETPSQGIATPASDAFYSPPYPEQLPLYAYELLEQPQPHRSCSTSHPDLVDNAGNWQRNHSESGLWSTQSFVAQPWNPNSYSGNEALNVNHTHAGNAILEPFGYPLQDHFPTTEVIQMDSAMSVDEDLSEDDDTTGEDEDLSEDDSDDSQAQSSLSRSGLTPNLGIARIQVDRWTIPVNDIQQSDTRMYVCNVLDCHTPFQRPEHLRRHVRSKHTDLKPFICKITQCSKPFSRSDNLGDHYWTHLDRGGRAGVNKKMTLSQLKFILTGQSGRKIFRKLRLKLQKHEEKERQKRSHGTLPARMERARL